jgi:hypothetical protein
MLIDGLRLRAALGRDDWAPPREYGEEDTGGGWILTRHDRTACVIVTAGRVFPDGITWVHASISHPDHDPTYQELKLLHAAVWGGTGWAIQVFAPTGNHINIHDHALHLWGQLDGRPFTPDFGYAGTI